MKKPAIAVLLAVSAVGCASKSDVETMGDSLRADMQAIEEGQRLLLAQIRGGLDSLEASDVRRESTGRGEFERRVARLEGRCEELMDIVTQNNQLLNDIYQDRGARPGTSMGRPTQSPGTSMPGDDEPSQFYAMAQEVYSQACRIKIPKWQGWARAAKKKLDEMLEVAA